MVANLLRATKLFYLKVIFLLKDFNKYVIRQIIANNIPLNRYHGLFIFFSCIKRNKRPIMAKEKKKKNEVIGFYLQRDFLNLLCVQKLT